MGRRGIVAKQAGQCALSTRGWETLHYSPYLSLLHNQYVIQPLTLLSCCTSWQKTAVAVWPVTALVTSGSDLGPVQSRIAPQQLVWFGSHDHVRCIRPFGYYFSPNPCKFCRCLLCTVFSRVHSVLYVSLWLLILKGITVEFKGTKYSYLKYSYWISDPVFMSNAQLIKC